METGNMGAAGSKLIAENVKLNMRLDLSNIEPCEFHSPIAATKI